MKYDYVMKAIGAFMEEEGLNNHLKNRYCEYLRTSLNEEFPNFKCMEVLYTENTDNEFFGCRIYPYMNDNTLINCVVDPEYRCENGFYKYYLELDSKLFHGMVSFSPAEVSSLILSDINKLTRTTCIGDFVDAVNNIMANECETIDKCSLEKSKEFFNFIFMEFLRFNNSVFCECQYNPLTFDTPDFLLDSEYLSNAFVDAVDKMKRMTPEFNAENPSIFSSKKFAWLLLQWYLKIYKTIDVDRYPLELLKKAVSYSGSELFKRAVNGVIHSLTERYWNGKGMDDMVSESASGGKRNGLFSQMKMNGLKSIEEDLYEFKMRIRNVDTQDEALLLMRQINNRMAIIDEYLMDDTLPDKEREKWFGVYDKYQSLRENLSDKKVYNRKMYGLYVDYNTLQQMNDNNAMLNTYY